MFRTVKPWVVPAQVWQASGMTAREIAEKSGMAVVVAKPSNNIYLGSELVEGRLDAVSAGIANLASHGEMAIHSVHSIHPLTPLAVRLMNILPSKVEFDSKKIGNKNGKLLNHFGYRKVAMNLVADTLDDHAWIACALSYSKVNVSIPGFMFDPAGGGIAGGITVETPDGAIFRGSGIADSDGILVSPEDAALVSLAANGHEPGLQSHKIATCITESDFASHRFFSKLQSMLSKPS